MDLAFPALAASLVLLDDLDHFEVLGVVLFFVLRQPRGVEGLHLDVLVLVAVAEGLLVAGVEQVLAFLSVLHLAEVAGRGDLEVCGGLFELAHDDVVDEELAALGLLTLVLGDMRQPVGEVLGD